MQAGARTVISLLLLFVCVRSLGASADPPALRARLSTLKAEAVARIDDLKKHSDDPYDVVTRFDDALQSLDDARAAADPAYLAERTIRADLDAEVLKALEDGAASAPSADTPGLHEIMLASATDGKLEPAAVIVPRGYDPRRPVSMVVALHGMGETESDVVSRRQLRELADRSGALVVAPYAFGDGRYPDRSVRNVYTVADVAAKRFHADPHHVYLIGYSNGGIGVFHVARSQPTRFAAICSVAGALDGADSDAIAKGFRHGAVYVVAGGRDVLSPPSFGKRTVAYLRNAGIPARYYEAPSASHDLDALAPAITAAWNDMFSGVTQSQNDSLGALPTESHYSPTFLPNGGPSTPHITGI